jgi:hypothetical protein
MASRIKRDVPVTIGDVLAGRVKLGIQSLDRLHLLWRQPTLP